MSHIRVFLTTLLSLTASLLLHAGIIQEPSRNDLGSPTEFVDPLLANENATTVLTFTENHVPMAKAKVLYSQPILIGGLQQISGWVTRTEIIRGKKQSYTVYDKPFVYYGILDFPEGRFYGLFTTGFDDLYDASNKPIEDLHPLGDVKILIGTLVNTDGSEEEIVGITPDKLLKKLSKPNGTYNMREAYSFKDIQFTFNPGGSGKAVFKKQYRRQAVPYMASNTTERNKAGRVVKRHRRITGGYHFFVKTTASTNYKWEVSDNGLITITFIGKPTVIVKCEVDGDTEFQNTLISESDKRIERQLHRQDITSNEDALKEKKLATERAKDYFTENKELHISPQFIGNDKIITCYRSSKYDDLYFYSLLQRKKFDNTNEWYDTALRNIPDYIASYASSRDYGIITAFPEIRRKLTKAIENTSFDLLKSATDYYAYDLADNGKSGDIRFVSNGKLYSSHFQLNNNNQLDNESLTSTLNEDKSVTDNDAKINNNHDKIIEYKKDKRRGKIVKKYEKTVKKIYPINTQFTTLNEAKEIINQQKELLKTQDLILNELE